jgi:hypothetical protein
MQVRCQSLLGVVLLAVGSSCGPASSEPGTPMFDPGVLILTDSLMTVNNTSLPCCNRDSAGIRATTIRGSLMFYAAARYTDTLNTPAGPRSRVCVQEVPNGSSIARNQLLTLPDGSSYLLLPCSQGFYRFVRTELLKRADGTSTTQDVVASSGGYAWAPNRLSLTEQATLAHPETSLSGAQITLTLSGQRYRFLALPSY